MADFDEQGTELPPTDITTLTAIQRAEIDGQIATAKAYPRSVAQFARDARELVTMDEEMAQACIYSLPRGRGRDRKVITGPSARFAEIISYSFGNSRSGGRVVDIGRDSVTGQGVFHDLEKNVMITIEVQRRILDSGGRRYNSDMINVTGNAAVSIAVRNAQLKGIPKALWLPIYEAARQTAIGDIKTLPVRRDAAMGFFMKAGVTAEQVFAKLDVQGVEDIGLDELEIMTGWRTALRDGTASVDAMFAPPEDDVARPGAVAGGSSKETAAAIAARAAAIAARDAAAKTDAGQPHDARPWMAKLHTANDLDELNHILSDAQGDLPKGSTALEEVERLYTTLKDQIA